MISYTKGRVLNCELWLGHFSQLEICVTLDNLLSSRVATLGMCLPPSVTCCLRNESKLEEGVDGLKGSVPVQPINLLSPLLLDKALCNIWPALWSEDEVYISSYVNKNNVVISHCGVAQQFICLNVKSVLYFSIAREVELPIFIFEFDRRQTF